MSPEIRLTGVYPRSEDLVEKTRSYERGRLSLEEMGKQFDLDTRRIVQLQEDNNFDTISDGSLIWHDQLRPLTKTFHGITAGTRYSRWFDTNTFFQKPLVKGKVSLSDFQLREFIRSDLLPRNRNWNVTLPGPYTFSQLVDNQYYPSLAELISDVAEAENHLAQQLRSNGVTSLQLAEPCLVYQPYRKDLPDNEELEEGFRAINRTVKGLEADFTVQTFFGDASLILPRLLKLNANAIGIDVFSTDYSGLHLETHKKLVLGIIDSQDSNVEDPRWIVETTGRVLKHIETRELVLQPSSDMKFVPRNVADEKIRSLIKARNEIGESN
jgi:5-methyltetrahydropteroyltriglutamate--homocysteine methyltransferase